MTVYAGPGPWGPGTGPLTQAEFDGNNYDFDTRLIEVETNPPQPNDIVGITLTGSYLSMTQRDGTILGPVPFSPPMARWRNEWAVSTAYVAFDFVTVSEVGLFGVLQDHTSDETAFDANATDVEGNLLYRKVIGFSGTSANVADLFDVVFTDLADKDLWAYDLASETWINKSLTVVLDDGIDDTQGAIAYRNATEWVALAPGTSGQVLTTGGEAANPAWDDVTALGVGDVAGPASAIDDNIVTFDSTTGKLIQDSGIAASSVLVDGDLGTNVATFLATPSSANLRAMLTDEVGTGAAYFVGGALGTPASATLTNATGLPLTGIASISNLRVLANVSGGSAAASANTMTAILDAVLGSTRGGIPARGASAWSAVSPGKAGYTLQLSSSLDPVWVQVAAGGKGGTTGTAPSNWLLGADYATAAALAANTYSNGSSGVGATLTGNSNGALSVDGSTPLVNDRILVKDETTGSHNGVYSVTTVGSGGAAYVLTRATDYDQTTEIVQGSAVAVSGGTENAGTAWVLSTSSAITIGSTSLDYDGLTAQLPDVASGQVLGNGNSFTAPAASTSLSAIIDRAIASTRGAILYRGSGGWAALSPGTSGYVLASSGAGADPAWTAAGAGSGLGDVSGGSTSTDGELAAYDGTGGKTLKQSFAKFSGPASSVKTYTLPNASSTILTDNAAVTAAQGGTGLASYTQGDLLYASAGTTISKLAKNTSATRYLSNTGASNNPAWSQIDLTNGVTGVLPIANGGTGASAPPLNLIFTLEDVMTNAEETHRFIPPASSFPSGASGSYGTAGTAATGSTTISAKKNGSAFATFVWAGAGTAATVTIGSTTSFNGTSDVLTLEGPATADTTLAKIGITLTGSRS